MWFEELRRVLPAVAVAGLVWVPLLILTVEHFLFAEKTKMDLPTVPVAEPVTPVAPKGGPDWRSPATYTMLAKQILAFATIAGVLSMGDAQTLGDSISKCVAAVFVFIANALVVIHFAQGHFRGQKPTSGAGGAAAVLLLALLGLGCLGSPVQAEPLLPWRASIEHRLRQLEKRDVAPPLQAFPIQGHPQQSFPIAGPPLQQFQQQGPIQQQLPIQGAPQQVLPPGGQPQQALPIQGPIGQPLPLVPEQAPMPSPGAPGGAPQRLSNQTRVLAIWR